MGRAKVELAPLKNQRLRKWFPLSANMCGNQISRRLRVILHAIDASRHQQRGHAAHSLICTGADAEGKKGSSNVTGDLELVVQWRHNPALAFAPFADAVEDVPEGKKPNELRVAAIQARRLAVKDKSMMGKGTSDPVVTFELGSVKAETTVKKKTLNPVQKSNCRGARRVSATAESCLHAIDATHWSIAQVKPDLEGGLREALLRRGSWGLPAQSDSGRLGRCNCKGLHGVVHSA